MSKTVLIVGSSRSDGNTFQMVHHLHENVGIPFIDLSKYEISDYDYKHRNRGDDFLDLMREILDNYDTLVFVSPIYWYSMSGIMKCFFDRITDLLTIEKDLGRKLRGKKMAMICCSGSEKMNDGFEEPFRLSAGYLGMQYLGFLHLDLTNNMLSENQKNLLENFYSSWKIDANN